ncbi:MAG: hypothetical protein PHX38_03430 [Sulfuricella sp.]|nr:hypothetical protein [Sulfuricella sp.]
MTSPLPHHGDYTLTAVYGRMDEMLAREVAAFWLSHQAIANPQEAMRRANEVVIVVRNAAGELVGVNSVYADTFNRSTRSWYFYRMFVREQDRVPGLASRMTLAASDFLRAQATSAPDIAGMVLITENSKLMKPAAQRKLRRLGWHYVGRGPLGRDAWKIDFSPSGGAPETT